MFALPMVSSNPASSAAALTDPVSASMPMNSAWRTGVHPSAPRLTGTGAKAGMRGRGVREGGVICEVKADFGRVGNWFFLTYRRYTSARHILGQVAEI
jgi:hypothetical protein